MKFLRKVSNVIKSTCCRLFSKRKLNVLNTEETIKKILAGKLSIARFGDGEIGIMEGKDISFQEYDERLQNKLLSIQQDDKFMVCIPDVFNKLTFNRKILTKTEYNFWRISKLANYYYWVKYFSRYNLMGDAFISRFYLRYADKTNIFKTVELLKQIWNNRDIVFVEGEKSRLGVGNDLFDNSTSIQRILCPPVNAFRKYDEILEYIKQTIDKDKLIILALGPSASAMAYELSQLGYQALDLGHIDIEYEWYLSQTTKKIAINNKYVNEVAEGRNPEDNLPETYKSQILINFNSED